MSSNNVVWVMKYGRLYHVFYSGCYDNDPIEPDYDNRYYQKFDYRSEALEYAHDVVNQINKESHLTGMFGVEYGVQELIELEFYKVESSKPSWIPEDIDDYFRNHPSDLPRIKYDRLLEAINKREIKYDK